MLISYGKFQTWILPCNHREFRNFLLVLVIMSYHRAMNYMCIVNILQFLRQNLMSYSIFPNQTWRKYNYCLQKSITYCLISNLLPGCSCLMGSDSSVTTTSSSLAPQCLCKCRYGAKSSKYWMFYYVDFPS